MVNRENAYSVYKKGCICIGKMRKNKDDPNMIPANLKDIKQQVINNSLKFQKQIEVFEKRINNSGWNKG